MGQNVEPKHYLNTITCLEASKLYAVEATYADISSKGPCNEGSRDPSYVLPHSPFLYKGREWHAVYAATYL